MSAGLISPFRAVADGTSLPPRVKDAIRELQDHSEILIGWIQLAVVATFGTLYAVAPKAFSADIMFEPVPWALALYSAFTVLRLVLAYRRRLPGWFLAVSVIIDMALLIGLIWSFHLQYEQPPAFVLKAPTLLYVFIFIALRTLRFEARYVLLAGAVAALGWLLLILLVITADPGNSMITRDYVAYMTSNSILLGAEFDKIVSILVVTGILALALVRARRLMVRAIAQGAAARELSRFFSPEIARRITEAELEVAPGHGEVREAAILIVDLRRFTPFAHGIDANEVMSLLTAYQARMVPVIQRHGGSVDKFLGDGILATFGAAVPMADHAAAALAAADAVFVEAAAWNAERVAAGKPEMIVKLAVTTGPVIFGAVGDDTRLEYTVIGDAVNLAAKLEKHTAAEDVRGLAPQQAVAAAESQGYRAPAPRELRRGVRVIGVDEPLDLVVLAA